MWLHDSPASFLWFHRLARLSFDLGSLAMYHSKRSLERVGTWNANVWRKKCNSQKLHFEELFSVSSLEFNLLDLRNGMERWHLASGSIYVHYFCWEDHSWLPSGWPVNCLVPARRSWWSDWKSDAVGLQLPCLEYWWFTGMLFWANGVWSEKHWVANWHRMDGWSWNFWLLELNWFGCVLSLGPVIYLELWMKMKGCVLSWLL